MMLDLVAELRRELGFQPAQLGAGGGLGIAYTRERRPADPACLRGDAAGCPRGGNRAPRSANSPRSWWSRGDQSPAPPASPCTRSGSIKDIPGVRRYVAVDGGMGDNIRPKLYGARYEVLLAAAPEAPADGKVTIAGKYCESTDILVTDTELPPVESGDILCLPATGRLLPCHGEQLQRDAAAGGGDGESRCRAGHQAARDARRPPPGGGVLGLTARAAGSP